MSLVNDVLRNLQRKQTAEPSQEQAQLLFRQVPEVKKHHGLAWLAAVALLLIAAAALYCGWAVLKYQKNLDVQKAKLKNVLALRAAKNHPSDSASGTTEAQSQVSPQTVELANPTLKPTADSALPPPPDLQGAIAARVKAKAVTTTAATVATTSDPAKTITVPLSTLQSATATAANTGATDFSLVEVHNPDRQLVRIDDLISVGQLDEAERLLQGVPEDPNDQSLVIVRAKILSARRHNSEAVQLLENFNYTHPPSADGLGLLATLYDLVGRYQKSQETYQRLVTFWPDSAKWWLGLAIAAKHNGQYSESIVAFERVLNFPSQLSPEVNSYAQVQLRALTTDHPTYY